VLKTLDPGAAQESEDYCEKPAQQAMAHKTLDCRRKTGVLQSAPSSAIIAVLLI